MSRLSAVLRRYVPVRGNMGFLLRREAAARAGSALIDRQSTARLITRVSLDAQRRLDF